MMQAVCMTEIKHYLYYESKVNKDKVLIYHEILKYMYIYV